MGACWQIQCPDSCPAVAPMPLAPCLPHPPSAPLPLARFALGSEPTAGLASHSFEMTAVLFLFQQRGLLFDVLIGYEFGLSGYNLVYDK